MRVARVAGPAARPRGAAARPGGAARPPHAGRAHGSRPTPALGGPTSRPVPAPTTGMDLLELAVAARLRHELAGQGLTLDHLDRPPWRGRENAVVRCTGYLDGLVGTVRVSLSRSPSGTVEFDARLEDGVVATQNLVRRLEAEGWTGGRLRGPGRLPRRGRGADRVRRAPACRRRGGLRGPRGRDVVRGRHRHRRVRRGGDPPGETRPGASSGRLSPWHG